MSFRNEPVIVWSIVKDLPTRYERVVFGGQVVVSHQGKWIGEIFRKIIDTVKGTEDLRYLDHARFDREDDCRAWVQSQKAKKSAHFDIFR